MRILVMSDTHRKDRNVERVLEKEGAFDRAIHLGDIEGSQQYISQLVNCPIDIVAGNNDFRGDLPREKVVTLDHFRILLTHGHYYFVSIDTEILAREAKKRGYDIVMYGHTHRPKVEIRNGVVLVNPGSLSYPRQEGRRPSYIVMEYEEGGQPGFEIRYLD